MSKVGEFPALLYIVEDCSRFLGAEEIDYDELVDGEGVAVYELQSVKTVSKRSTLID